MTADDKSAPPASASVPPRGTLDRRVRWACVLSLVALGLITWSLFHPTPVPVLLAMSVGQGLGTLALLIFGAAIYLDLRRARLIGRSLPPPPRAPSATPPDRP
jgi:hypothetical protein